LIGKDETIEVPGVGGRKPRTLSRQILGEILEPRVEEIFTLIYQELVRSGYDELASSGVVVTGGSRRTPGRQRNGRTNIQRPGPCGLP